MTISNEDYQRALRVLIQLVSGNLISYGIFAPDSTWLMIIAGAIMSAGSYMWTLYGNRAQAKINEVAVVKMDDGRKLVEGMKVNDAKVADLAPANVTATPTAKL